MLSHFVSKYLARTGILILPSILFLGINACSYKIAELKPFSYYPIEPDYFTIYKINEIKYPINGIPTEKTYYLKQQITSVSDLNSGIESKNFIIERFTKPNLDSEWKLDSIWNGNLSINRLIITENNQKKLKLIFPFEKNSVWNVNEYNQLDIKEITYSDKFSDLKLKNFMFNNCIAAVEKADSNLIEKQVLLEIYAPNVGLVKKETTKLNYCQSSADCIGKKIINFGFSINQELIDYKK